MCYLTLITIFLLQLFVLLPLLAIVAARPQKGGGPDADATILKYDNDNIGVDGYNFAFETSNGIAHQEEGKLNNAGSENEAMEVHGSYSYTDVTGKKITVTFVADENGFRPQTSLSRK